MAFNLTIQGKPISFSLLALVFTSVVGGTGYWASVSQGNSKDEILVNSSTISYPFQADMMYEALHADILKAMMAGSRNDQRQKEEIKQEAQGHMDRFPGSIQSLESAPLNSEIKSVIAKTKPGMEIYIKTVATFLDLAFSDIEAAHVRFKEFNEAFASLEGQMSTLSDVIEASSKEINANANTSTGFTRNAIIIVTSCAWVILLVIAFYITRAITRPLQQAVITANTVAKGDLTQHIEVMMSKDEVGLLMQALKNMNESLAGIVGDVRDATDSIATGAKQIAAGTAICRSAPRNRHPACRKQQAAWKS